MSVSVWHLYSTRELAHILHQLDQKQRIGGVPARCRCRRCYRLRLGAEEPGYLQSKVKLPIKTDELERIVEVTTSALKRIEALTGEREHQPGLEL